jgi:hypothetical protein
MSRGVVTVITAITKERIVIGELEFLHAKKQVKSSDRNPVYTHNALIYSNLKKNLNTEREGRGE